MQPRRQLPPPNPMHRYHPTEPFRRTGWRGFLDRLPAWLIVTVVLAVGVLWLVFDLPLPFE